MSWAAITLPAQCLEGIAPPDFEIVIDPVDANDSMFVVAKKKARARIRNCAPNAVALATSDTAFFDALALALPDDVQNIIAHEYAVLCYRSLSFGEDDAYGVQCKKLEADLKMFAKALGAIAGDEIGLTTGTNKTARVSAVTVGMGPYGATGYSSWCW